MVNAWLSLLQAKTIDLCNNPKTKEPKLQAARRIIAEWPSLDQEQATFTASVDAKYKAQEAAFAAEAPDAGDGAEEKKLQHATVAKAAVEYQMFQARTIQSSNAEDIDRER